MSIQGVVEGSRQWEKGGGSPPLRHDWSGNGLQVLPYGVGFATEIHSSTSVVVRVEGRTLGGVGTDARNM